MQIQFGGRTAVDLLQERQKFLGPVAVSDSPDDLARQDVESGIQAGSAMTLVVVSPPLNLPRAQTIRTKRLFQFLSLGGRGRAIVHEGRA